MDKQKEEKWYQLWWVKFILTIVSGMIVLILGAYIFEPEKTTLALTRFFSPIKFAWDFITEINIPLAWLLLAIILSVFIGSRIKRTKGDRYELLKKEHEQLTKEHEVIRGEHGFFLKEHAAASGRVKTLENQYTKQIETIEQLNATLEYTKKQLAQRRERVYPNKDILVMKLEGDLSETQENLSQAISTRDELEGKLKTAEEELKAAKHRIVSMEQSHSKTLGSVIDQNIELEGKLNKSKEDNNKISALLTQGKKERDSLEYRLNTSQTDHRQTRKEYADTLAALKEAKERINQLTEVKEPEKPPYFNYRKDKFFKWIWEWEWEYDNLAKKWMIVNLCAFCPDCDVELIDQSIHMERYELARCPQCKKNFGQQVDGLIVETDDTEDTISIYKLIESRVKKGKYKVDGVI